MANTQGDRGLFFDGGFNVDAILENQRKVIDGFNNMKKAAENSSGGNSSNSGAGNISAFREAQLKAQQILRDSRLETERLKREQQALKNEYEKSRISQQNYRTETSRIAAEQAKLRAQTNLARTAQVAANGSYKQAQDRLVALGKEIRNVENGFEKNTITQRNRIKEYDALNARLKEFDSRLGNSQRNIGNYRSALNGVGSSLVAMAGMYISAYAAIAGVSKIISNNAAISDSLADVRRTAGLTEKEADNLLTTFKGFDTRTSLKGLVDIAVIAGQLGVAKNEITGFTRSIDALSIVLSGEIPGGAEEVASALGKINGVFDTQKQENTSVEESFNKTGSAILKLGQTGLATGDFLVDFTQRVSGTAKQAGIALPTILAYGSVLEEAGKSAEVAGTSLKRIISGLSTNRTQYYAIAKLGDANLTLKEFTRIINTDTSAALQVFFKGLNSGNPSQSAFADRLKTIPRLAGEARESIISLAQNQAKLTEKIASSTGAYEDSTLVAEQFRLKNDTLAGSIDKLNKVFENATTSGNTGRFFKGIIDYIRISLTEFTKLVNSSSWKEFFSRLGNGGAEFEIKTAFAATQKRTNDNAKFLYPTGVDQSKTEAKLKGLGQERFNMVLQAMEKTANEAKGALDKFNEGVKDGTVKNAGATAEEFKANADKAKMYYKDMLALRKKFGYDVKATAKAEVKSDESGVVDKSLKVKQDAEKRKADIAIHERNGLQAKIDELTNKSLRKQQTADDAEIDSIRDKYRKMEKEIQEFNNKNKGKYKVDSSGLPKAEKSEVQAAIDKQSNNRLKAQLDEQGKLFEQFENYKTKLGATKAAERFKGEFTTAEAFQSKLEAELANAISIDPTQMNEAQKETLRIRTEALQKFLDNKQQREDAAYEAAYISAMTNAQKLAEIESDYQNKRKALGENATTEQLGNLSRERDARIQSQNVTNAQLVSGYDKLMQNYDAMTRQQVLARLNIIKDGYKKEYAAGKLTAQQLKDLLDGIDSDIDKLNGNNSFKKVTTAIQRYKDAVAEMGAESNKAKAAQKDMYAAIADGADDLNTVIGELGSSFEQLGIGGDGLQKVFKDVQGVIGGAGTIAKGLATGNPVDVVAGSIKLLTSAIDLFNNKDRKLQKQIDGYKNQLSELERAYKQLDRAVANSVGESIYTDQASQIRNLQKQQELLIKQRDAERNKKKPDQEKIKAYQDQIDEIPNQIADINKAISENLIQTNFKDLSSNLADALAEAFASGEDSAAAFDNVFKNVIGNAIKNSLRLKILEPIISDFTSALTKYAQANNNSVIGFDFDAWKKAIKTQTDLYQAGLAASADYFSPDAATTPASAPGIAGKLQRELTETTGSEFLGVTRNIFEIQMRQEILLNSTVALLTEGNIIQNQIQVNTFNGVIELRNAVARLDAVVTNTKPPQTERDLGIK